MLWAGEASGTLRVPASDVHECVERDCELELEPEPEPESALPMEVLARRFPLLPAARRPLDGFITHARGSGQDQCKRLHEKPALRGLPPGSSGASEC